MRVCSVDPAVYKSAVSTWGNDFSSTFFSLDINRVLVQKNITDSNESNLAGMPMNVSMPGAWNDSWDDPEPVIHELDSSIISVGSNLQFFPTQNISLHEAPYLTDELPLSYSERTEGTKESNGYNHSALRRDSGYEDLEIPPTVNKPQSPDISDTSDHNDGVEDDSPPLVIAVFGQTGTGKTSLIKAVTGKDLQIGHDLTSCKNLSSCHKNWKH